MKRILTTLLTGWAMLSGNSTAPAQSAAPSRVIIVFDASGSMYG